MKNLNILSMTIIKILELLNKNKTYGEISKKEKNTLWKALIFFVIAVKNK